MTQEGEVNETARAVERVLGRKCREKPRFFKEIAAGSAQRWEQLEADPDLAAPWRQLFRQVDSPRHVLSELLQNAEDARATWARCAVKDNEFVFEHDGLDFDADTLGSLCRFGYSNKRTLHTIGFRGIGFKTTFSLGPVVTVETPTLAFQFGREQFTLPVWVEAAEPLTHTRIRVKIEDEKRRAALSENLAEWLQSPVPLLFFTSLQSLEISGVRVEKEPIGPGPVSNSEWIVLKSEHPLRLLKITADAEEMPADAVEEIRKERGDSEFQPAACSLDLIFGLNENRVYTVLPTQVMPQLPFSCNAPFVQEPSRVRILDPSHSPTNRWLLERAGRLAAQALYEWVSHQEIGVDMRVRGYGLLPSTIVPPLTALDGAVRGIVLRQMNVGLKLCNCLIGQDSSLYTASDCADLPRDFVEAWGAEVAQTLLGKGKKACIHVSVPDETRENLTAWGLLEARDESDLKGILAAAETLPRPATNDSLVLLWTAFEELLGQNTSWWMHEAFVYPVVPLMGSDRLHRPKDVCRTVAHSEALSPEDHAVLCEMVKIADGSFLELFDGNASDLDAPEGMGQATGERISQAGALFRRFTLENLSLQRMFEVACREVFGKKSTAEVRLHLTRIAVKADLSAPDAGLAYLCRDGAWRYPKNGLIHSTGMYEDLLPERWLGEFCISKQYDDLFPSEDAGRMNRWLNSFRSGLRTFPVPRRTTSKLWSQSSVHSVAVQRGGTPPDFWRATTRWEFDLADYDWNAELVSHWEAAAAEDETVWTRIVAACAHSWSDQVPVYAVAKIDRPKGAARYMVSDGLTAAWLHRLKSLPCLPDDKLNQPELPHNLLYRTPETEPLLNIEKFVHRNLDNSQTRPLLELLGVRSQPQSADKLIQRLHSLSETGQPPLTAVLDLYRALDGVYSHLDTAGRTALQRAFEEGTLILDHENVWRRRTDVFQANDEELPGIAIIHPEMRALGLWDRLNVDRSPTLDKVLDWLRLLPSGKELAAGERRRVAAILGRTPRVAFDACQHWLSRGGTWVPWRELRYFVVARGGEAAGDVALFPNIRRQIADMSMLNAGQVEILSGHLRALREVLTHAVEATHPAPLEAPEWMRALAVGILRVQPAVENEETYDPETAALEDGLQAVDLYYSTVQEAQALRLVPFLDGVQVGTPITARALWEEKSLYSVGPAYSHHRELVEQIERRFILKGLRVAVGDCVGRSASFIEGYFADNFVLRSLEEAERDLGLKSAAASSTVGSANVTLPSAVSLNGTLTSGVTPMPSPIASDEIAATSDENEENEQDFQTTQPDATAPGENQENGRQDEPGSNDAANLGTFVLRRAPVRHSPLEIYLAGEGFVYNEARRCYERPADRAVVRKESGSAFHAQYDANGERQEEYWEHSASVTDGVIIPAEIWLYLELRPDHCSLVALGQDGKPLVLSGETLLRWKAQQRITLTATAYRLKFLENWALVSP